MRRWASHTVAARTMVAVHLNITESLSTCRRDLPTSLHNRINSMQSSCRETPLFARRLFVCIYSCHPQQVSHSTALLTQESFNRREYLRTRSLRERVCSITKRPTIHLQAESKVALGRRERSFVSIILLLSVSLLHWALQRTARALPTFKPKQR